MSKEKDTLTLVLKPNWKTLAAFLDIYDMKNLARVIPYATQSEIEMEYYTVGEKGDSIFQDLHDPNDSELNNLISRITLYPHHREHQKETVRQLVKSVRQARTDPTQLAERKSLLSKICKEEGLDSLARKSPLCQKFLQAKTYCSAEECVAELILENELLRYGRFVFCSRFHAYRDMLLDLVYEGSRLSDGDYHINGSPELNCPGTLAEEWNVLNEDFLILSVDPLNQPTKMRWITAAILLVSSQPFNDDCRNLAISQIKHHSQDEEESEREELTNSDIDENLSTAASSIKDENFDIFHFYNNNQ